MRSTLRYLVLSKDADNTLRYYEGFFVFFGALRFLAILVLQVDLRGESWEQRKPQIPAGTSLAIGDHIVHLILIRNATKI